MKKAYLSVLTGIFLSAAMASPADAERRPGYFFDCGKDVHDRMYLQSNENAYDSAWNDSWKPVDWADSAESAQAVIDNFYARRVLTDQFLNRDTPVLEVGQGFIDLSSQDQRRVVRFVAYAFDIDGLTGNGAMQVQLDRKDAPVGLYNRGKVQLY